jgi:hypothetical protein
VRDGSGEPVEPPNAHDIKSALVSIGDQTIEFWPGVFGSAHAGVNVFAGNLPSAGVRELL